jgi:hypothetical protein
MVRMKGLDKLKNSIDINGIRTRNLPACNIMTRLTTLACSVWKVTSYYLHNIGFLLGLFFNTVNADDGRLCGLVVRPRGTLYQQNLGLSSPSRGGHTVAIVRSRTKAKEFVFLVCLNGNMFV